MEFYDPHRFRGQPSVQMASESPPAIHSTDLLCHAALISIREIHARWTATVAAAVRYTVTRLKIRIVGRHEELTACD